MILPSLVLQSRINQRWDYSGLDSLEQCLDQQHFKNYPHKIKYEYNSRGFRDSEWPDSLGELKNSVWCVGDSFTVGLGSPLEHTWPWLLGKKSGRRIINVSMDGASNDWICRQVQSIAEEINPKKIVIMWSYVHRREHTDHNLDDEQRRLFGERSDVREDLLNFKHCMQTVGHVSAVHLSIPKYRPDMMDYQLSWDNVRGPDWPELAPTTLDQMQGLPEFVKHELKQNFQIWADLQQSIEQHMLLAELEQNLIKVDRLDLARDAHHFDLITAGWVVDQILPRLNS